MSDPSFGEYLRAVKAASDDVGFAVPEHRAPELRELARTAGWLTREGMEAAGHSVGLPVAIIDDVPYYAPPIRRESDR